MLFPEISLRQIRQTSYGPDSVRSATFACDAAALFHAFPFLSSSSTTPAGRTLHSFILHPPTWTALSCENAHFKRSPAVCMHLIIMQIARKHTHTRRHDVESPATLRRADLIDAPQHERRRVRCSWTASGSKSTPQSVIRQMCAQ